jgi:biotin carboxylase
MSADLAGDKMALLSLAERLGLEVPATRCPKPDDDLDAIVEEIGLPAIVKPIRGMGSIGVEIGRTRDALQRCLASRLPLVDSVFDLSSLLVQEWVPGEVHDVCTLFNRGEPRAVLTQRRLLMYPSRGGPGIFNETTYEPELAERAIHLLRHLNWHGPAQVEFKVDPRSDSVKLIEVNGRFWGTLDLAVTAGVDFPTMAAEMAIRGDVEPASDYPVGLRFRWPIPFAALHAFERGRSSSSFWQLVQPHPEVPSDLWLTDPLPWLAESWFAAHRLIRRALQKWRPGSSSDPTAPRLLHDPARLRSAMQYNPVVSAEDNEVAN